MLEKIVDLQAEEGHITTFICHPERNGPHPVIIFFMDAPGIREELRDMARRYAASGYYVMLPNLYYRSGVMELGPVPAQDDVEAIQKIVSYIDSLTPSGVMADCDVLLGYADADEPASRGPAGTVGYCMSGRFAVYLAASHPGRIKAAGSIYGTTQITDRSDSPHLAALKASAELYFAFAEKDHFVPLDDAKRFEQAMIAGHVNAEVEFYWDFEHGFAFPQRAAYNKTAAERHWERMLALFSRNLNS